MIATHHMEHLIDSAASQHVELLRGNPGSMFISALPPYLITYQKFPTYYNNSLREKMVGVSIKDNHIKFARFLDKLKHDSDTRESNMITEYKKEDPHYDQKVKEAFNQVKEKYKWKIYSEKLDEIKNSLLMDTSEFKKESQKFKNEQERDKIEFSSINLESVKLKDTKSHLNLCKHFIEFYKTKFPELVKKHNFKTMSLDKQKQIIIDGLKADPANTQHIIDRFKTYSVYENVCNMFKDEQKIQYEQFRLQLLENISKTKPAIIETAQRGAEQYTIQQFKQEEDILKEKAKQMILLSYPDYTKNRKKLSEIRIQQETKFKETLTKPEEKDYESFLKGSAKIIGENFYPNLIYDKIGISTNLEEKVEIEEISIITGIDNVSHSISTKPIINQQECTLLKLTKSEHELIAIPQQPVWVSDHYAASLIFKSEMFKKKFVKKYNPHEKKFMYVPVQYLCQDLPLIFLRMRYILNLDFVNIIFKHNIKVKFSKPFMDAPGLMEQKFMTLIKTSDNLQEIAEKNDGDMLSYFKDYLSRLSEMMFTTLYSSSRPPQELELNNFLKRLTLAIYITFLEFTIKNIGNYSLLEKDSYFMELLDKYHKDYENGYFISENPTHDIQMLTKKLHSLDTIFVTHLQRMNPKLLSALAQPFELSQSVVAQPSEHFQSVVAQPSSNIIYECACSDIKHTDIRKDNRGRWYCYDDNGKPKKQAKKRIITKDSAPAPAPALAPAPARVGGPRICQDCGGTEWIHTKKAAGECKKCMDGGSHRLTNKHLYKNLLKLSQ
jgi:hypothetical protein